MFTYFLDPLDLPKGMTLPIILHQTYIDCFVPIIVKLWATLVTVATEFLVRHTNRATFYQAPGSPSNIPSLP